MSLSSERRVWVWIAWILYAVSLLRWPPGHHPGEGFDTRSRERDDVSSVRVVGEVLRPGACLFRGSSTVLQAIEASEGATRSADLRRLNLTAALIPGSVLRVPSVYSGFEPVISLNRSAAQELTGIPGIGPKLALRIVQNREKEGPFGVMEDLLRVPGIGKRKLEQIRKSSVLNGREP